MSQETSKTRAVRGAAFEEQYLRGRVIDIGCGSDLVVPYAEPFDLQHGDAQQIGRLRDQGAYDAVCSSHCLEHMRDVRGALQQWWSLVREGGHLILVVPDEDLYEQGAWPSLFNRDHKATFRLRKQSSWSPVSFDIEELVRDLKDAEVVSCELQDAGYDYALRKRSISRADRALFHFGRYWSAACRRLGILNSTPARAIVRLLVKLGAPIDQTAGAALAQIQVIVRKRGTRRGARAEASHAR
jgi:SAM-dependent methyltransferase